MGHFVHILIFSPSKLFGMSLFKNRNLITAVYLPDSMATLNCTFKPETETFRLQFEST